MEGLGYAGSGVRDAMETNAETYLEEKFELLNLIFKLLCDNFERGTSMHTSEVKDQNYLWRAYGPQ